MSENIILWNASVFYNVYYEKLIYSNIKQASLFKIRDSKCKFRNNENLGYYL